MTPKWMIAVVVAAALFPALPVTDGFARGGGGGGATAVVSAGAAVLVADTWVAAASEALIR